MITCPNCGNQIPEESKFCTVCGVPLHVEPPVEQTAQPPFEQAPMQGQPVPPQYQQPIPPQYQQPAPYNPSDHTADFDPADIAENKLFAMAPYLLGIIGIIIAIFAAPKSRYAIFHYRQALKIELTTVLVALITGILCWTIIVPIAGAICLLILFVVNIICFFNVCAGKAKDAPIVGSLKFFK